MPSSDTFGLPTTRASLGAVRIFSRDAGKEIHIEACIDREAKRGEQFEEIWWFACEQAARDVADECVAMLATAPFRRFEDGWVAFPAEKIRNLIDTAKTHLNVPTVTWMPDPPPARTNWTHTRCAWLGKLIGEGLDAKRIAEDPLIRSTPNNVYRQVHRLKLSFAAMPASATLLRLPIAVSAAYDRMAARQGLTRDAMIRRALIVVADNPGLLEHRETA